MQLIRINLLYCFITLFCFTLNSQVTFIKEDFFNQTVIDKGLLHPVGLTFDNRGRGYIWEKRGVVRLLDTDGVLIHTPLVDISEEVTGEGDHGLIGFALDPSFLVNGYFYLFYAVDRHHLLHFGTSEYNPNKTLEKQATIARITRYQADASNDFRSVIPNSRKVLVGKGIAERGFPILMPSHACGTLLFGEDGTLLASYGDASGFQRRDVGSGFDTYFEQALEDGIIQEKENVGSLKAQLIDNLAGKIIRIDPETGEGLPSNPFYDDTAPSAPRSRVWAMGLRNPYRMIYRPETGEHDPSLGQPGTLVIGDVGAGDWEELNILEHGGVNFGWPFYEGYEWQWQFWGQKVVNQDVENPLFKENLCDRQYLYFDELFQEEHKSQTYTFTNPCHPDIFLPASIPTFIHRRPSLAFSNASWNQPTRAFTGSFDEVGKAIAQSVVGRTDLKADDFDGYSIIPGCFYEGDNFPETYFDKLFVADFSGWIKTFTLDENNNVKAVEDFFQRDRGIVGVTQNILDGCLYYIHFENHSIHKICFGGNPPPVAVIEVNKTFGASPLKVEFTASSSSDPLGEQLNYFWDFGDGNTSTDENPIFTFSSPDNQPLARVVKLTVSDEVGNTDVSERLISLNNTPPQVSINSFGNGDQYPVSNTSFLRLAADVNDAEHEAEDLTYTWQVFLHHNVHFHPEPEIHDPISQVIISPLGCETEPYWYRIKLKVRDAAGLESYDEKEIFPYCGPPIIADFVLNGKVKDEGNHLDWSFIDNIQNIDKLELFRGAELSSLQPIFSTGDLSNTTFLDDTPINGLNYYQLKVTAEDGIYDFSNFIELKFPPYPLIEINPNPISSGTAFQLGLREALDDRITVKIFNSLGQRVADFSLLAEKNTKFLQSLTAPFLPTGVYWVEVENGDLVYGREVIIKE